MKTAILLLLLVLSCSWKSYAQEIKIKGNQGGLFSMGIRSTFSSFAHKGIGDIGAGFGGQFRLQLANRLNTEWFGDFMRGNIAQKVGRSDYHIGWNVMYYFTDKMSPVAKPYIVAGHCFDRTVLTENGNPSNRIVKNSSAIQAGAGVSFNLTERLDITLLSQYMFHLGKDIHAHISGEEVSLSLEKGTGIEGHLLVSVSINFKIADLWNSGKRK